jgi:hypothetical protein
VSHCMIPATASSECVDIDECYGPGTFVEGEGAQQRSGAW